MVAPAERITGPAHEELISQQIWQVDTSPCALLKPERQTAGYTINPYTVRKDIIHMDSGFTSRYTFSTLSKGFWRVSLNYQPSRFPHPPVIEEQSMKKVMMKLEDMQNLQEPPQEENNHTEGIDFFIQNWNILPKLILPKFLTQPRNGARFFPRSFVETELGPHNGRVDLIGIPTPGVLLVYEFGRKNKKCQARGYEKTLRTTFSDYPNLAIIPLVVRYDYSFPPIKELTISPAIRDKSQGNPLYKAS